jgi:hypothetical protein
VRRPRLVTSDDWPESELRAAVLAGELVPVGPCWSSPAEPQTPGLRAEAIAWRLPDARLVAGNRTAAWIWGAVSRPPAPLEVCISPQLRVPADPDVRLREVRLEEVDLVRFGALRVTTPERTAVDLLRTPGRPAAASHAGYGAPERDAVAGLLAIGEVSADSIRERLAALGRIPMVRQAERRLRGVLAERADHPALTRRSSQR